MASKKPRRYVRLDFSPEDDDYLIDNVKLNEPLFNPKHADYKNAMYRNRLWGDIGAGINKSGIVFNYFVNLCKI